MWILSGWNDHDRVWVVAATSRSERRTDRQRNVRLSLSLRHISPNSQSDTTCGERNTNEKTVITSRRRFLKTAALSGASLVIGFNGRRLLQATDASAVGSFKPNGWICINSDGTVILTIGKC